MSTHPEVREQHGQHGPRCPACKSPLWPEIEEALHDVEAEANGVLSVTCIGCGKPNCFLIRSLTAVLDA